MFRTTRSRATRSFIVTLATAALIAPLVVSTPAVAASAPAAKISVSKSSGTASAPLRYAYTKQTPKLTGVKASVAKTFRTLVDRAVKKRANALAEWREGCYVPGEMYMEKQGYLSTTVVSRAIYKSRYASVMVRVDTNPGCGGVNFNDVFSVTLDLKTGKSAKLSQFARTTAAAGKNTFDPAVIYRLERLSSGCVQPGSVHPRPGWGGGDDPKAIPAADAWTVTSKGITVGYARYQVSYGACGAVTATVPWKDVVRPTPSSKPKVTTTRFAGAERAHAVVSVRGGQVAMVWGGQGVPTCDLGQRTDKKAVLWGTEGWVSRSTLSFTKKGATYTPKPPNSRVHKATKNDLKEFSAEMRTKSAFQICGY